METLKLDVETLEVETFATAAEGDARRIADDRPTAVGPTCPRRTCTC